MRKLITLLSLACVVGLFAGSLQAEEWGDLTGTIIFDGDAPKPTPASITKDVEFCGKFGVVDESLVVNPKNGGVKNVVIYLYLRGEEVPVHESYEETAEGKVRLDNEKCRFEPHVALLRSSQTLVIGNKDTVAHNTKVDANMNDPINPIIPAKGELEQEFPIEERLPFPVSCSIHPWMKAWVLVKDNPYMAVTDGDGKFTIKNLPAGDWTFQFWHEKSGYLDEVTVGGKKTEWERGRPEFTIKAGVNDLGEIKVEPSVFED